MDYLRILQNHRITETQNGRGWKGPLWVIKSKHPDEAGSPTAGCIGPRPGGSWISPEKESTQPLWGACSRAPSPSEGRSSSSGSDRTSCASVCAHCPLSCRWALLKRAWPHPPDTHPADICTYILGPLIVTPVKIHAWYRRRIQVGRGLEPNPTLKAGCSKPHPVEFWASPVTEIPQPPWCLVPVFHHPHGGKQKIPSNQGHPCSCLSLLPLVPSWCIHGTSLAPSSPLNPPSKELHRAASRPSCSLRRRATRMASLNSTSCFLFLLICRTEAKAKFCLLKIP